MFDKLRAAAQGSSQPVDQAEALVERAASDPVAFVGIAVNFQVMETLDFTGNLGYILPGDEGATPLIWLIVSSCTAGTGAYSINNRWQRRC